MIARLTTLEYFPRDPKDEVVFDIFVSGGLPGIILCITFAQLFPSITAKQYPLQFLEIPGMYRIIQCALIFESSGVVQFLYAYFWAVEKLFCKSNTLLASNTSVPNVEEGVQTPTQQRDSNSDADTTPAPESTTHTYFKKALQAFKYIISTAITFFCIGFIIYCTSMGYSSLETPIPVQFFLLAFAMVFQFYCEGMKVAAVTLSHVSPEIFEQEGFSQAGKVQNLLTSQGEDGVKKFLLGRQLIVVPLGFIVAQVTSFNKFPKDLLDPVSYALLIDVGLPGILVLLQFAQLCPQLLAESHGKSFMSLRGGYSLVYGALMIEKFGLTSFVWLLYVGMDRFCCKWLNSGRDENNKTSQQSDLVTSLVMQNQKTHLFSQTKNNEGTVDDSTSLLVKFRPN